MTKGILMNLILTSIVCLFFSAPLESIAHVFEHDTERFDVSEETLHLRKVAPKLKTKVLKTALTAYKNALSHDNVKKHVLTVIDYSLPSSKERMWVFDLNKDKLLYKTFVAHGKNSGMTKANHFSNKRESKETSLGTFITKNTYSGSKGYSLNLKGLEKGFNDNAFERRVVIHGAWYVEPDFIKKQGRAGRSWGCPSVAKSLAKPLINTIKGGSVVFAYYPDKKYLNRSDYTSV
jgi:L,D-transpeptidase catalytic domain